MGLPLVPASSQYLTIPSAALSLNAGTIGLWFKPAFAPGATTEYSFIDSDGTRHHVLKSTSGNLMTVSVDGRTMSANAGGRFFTGVWSLLIFAFNKTGNVLSVYWNADQTAAAGSGTWGSTALGTNLYIGAKVGPASFFDGSIAEVATWSSPTALSAQDRLDAANGKRLNQLTTNLTGYWPLKHDANDRVGSNHGTVQGGAAFSSSDHPALIGSHPYFGLMGAMS